MHIGPHVVAPWTWLSGNSRQQAEPRTTEVSEYPNFFKLLEKLQTLDKPLVAHAGHR